MRHFPYGQQRGLVGRRPAYCDSNRAFETIHGYFDLPSEKHFTAISIVRLRCLCQHLWYILSGSECNDVQSDKLFSGDRRIEIYDLKSICRF